MGAAHKCEFVSAQTTGLPTHTMHLKNDIGRRVLLLGAQKFSPVFRWGY